MLNRSTREVGNCKFNRRIVLLFCLMVAVTFRANGDQFFLILDPYFYRSPLTKPIEGTKQTLLAYYRAVDSETLAPAKPQELAEKDRPASTQQTLDHARRLLAIVKPELIRDSSGVITALRLECPDPTFSSILLLPDLGSRYADLAWTGLLFCGSESPNNSLFPATGDGHPILCRIGPQPVPQQSLANLHGDFRDRGWTAPRRRAIQRRFLTSRDATTERNSDCFHLPHNLHRSNCTSLCSILLRTPSMPSAQRKIDEEPMPVICRSLRFLFCRRRPGYMHKV